MPPLLGASTLVVALSWAMPGTQDAAPEPPSLSDRLRVEVRVVDPAGVLVPGSEVVADASATLGAAAIPRARAIAGRGVATLLLEPGVWRLTSLAEGWWSWSRELTLEPGAAAPGPVTLELAPVGRVAGTLALAPGESPPDEMRLLVRRDTDAESWARELAADVGACLLDDRGRWGCEVPAEVSVDLELEMAPFSPRYFWNVEAPPGATRDLGRTPAVRGASVSGWVTGAEERESGQRVSVGLRAPGGGLSKVTRDKGIRRPRRPSGRPRARGASSSCWS